MFLENLEIKMVKDVVGIAGVTESTVLILKWNDVGFVVDAGRRMVDVVPAMDVVVIFVGKHYYGYGRLIRYSIA